MDKSTLALHNGLFAVKESFVHNQICSQKMFFNRATSSKTMPKKRRKKKKKGKTKKRRKANMLLYGFMAVTGIFDIVDTMYANVL